MIGSLAETVINIGVPALVFLLMLMVGLDCYIRRYYY